MVSRSLLRSLIAVAVLVPAVAFAQTTPPPAVTISTITGNPLKINVASDGSFQVFNNAVPGNGQIYPTSSQFGDMGVFANIGGTLFAPNFTAHGTTATSGIGTRTPWTSVSMSQVEGTGDGSSPFTVTVNLAATGTGVTLGMTVTYVNGDNFFRLRKQFSGPGNRTMKVFLGADIFLASSDAGIFFFEPTLHAPGGVDCAIPPTYHILLIPLQPATANHISDGVYSNVWTQIGQGTLNDNVTPAGCVDNGAALEWDNVLSPGVTSALIQSAVSFGSIPTITGIQPFTVNVDPGFVALFPGDTATFNVTTVHNPDTGFNAPIDLSLIAPEGFTGTFDKTHIPAPGDGSATLTLNVSPDIFPATYRGITVLGNGGDAAEAGSFTVDVICDPPVLLAINNPQSQTVKRGQTVTLTAKPEAGAVKYQWYAGHAGFTSTPIANATSQSFTTPAINSVSEFWVRITNACGTFDSQTATITPTD